MRAPIHVGRDAELDQIEAALGRIRSEQPAIVLVVGEAGMGKTSLLAEVAHRAEAKGVAVVSGACFYGGDGMSLAPLRAALRTVSDLCPPDVLDGLLADEPALAAVLPGATRRRADPQHRDDPLPAGEVEHAVLTLLGVLGERRPLLLALEDLHWADRSTLELLSFLARNLAGERVAVVATLRGEELDPGSPAGRLLGELGRLRIVERIELTGLPRGELVPIVMHATGRRPDTATIEDLWRRSGGNPFFVTELAVGDDGELPPTVRELLTLRLGAIPGPSAAIVRAAAVLGAEVDGDLLPTVLGLEARTVDAALRDAIEAGVLAVDAASGRTRFRHALLREAAYSDLLASERRRLHGAIADALAPRADSEPSLLAHHYACAGRAASALASSIEAARAAGLLEAVEHYGRALDLWPEVLDAESRTGVTLADLLAEACHCALEVCETESGIRFGRRLLEALDPRTEPELWAVAAVSLSELCWEAGDGAAAVALLDDAASALAEQRDGTAWARLLERRAFAALVSGDHGTGTRLAEEAVALATRIADPEVEVAALNRLGLAHCTQGIATGPGLLEQAFDRAHAAGLAKEAVRALVNLLLMQHAGCWIEEGLAAGVKGRAACAEMGVPPGYATTIDALYARLLTVAGRWDEAADVLADTAIHGPLRFRAYGALARAELASGRGDYDAVEAELAELASGWSGVVLLMIHRAALDAECSLARDRPDDTVRIVDEFLDLAALLPESTVLRLCAAGLGALLTLDAGPDAAVRYAECAESRGDERRALDSVPRDTDAWVSVARARHAAIRGESVVEHWGVAADEFLRAAAVPRAAWADFERARALVATGARDEATTAVARAHVVAAGIGAGPLRAACEDLVRRARLDVDGIERVGAADLGLTDRETEVLRLVAIGRTNREIAASLYIAPKTASVHVSNILRKVGVTNRGEAAALAHRHGLVEDSRPSDVPA